MFDKVAEFWKNEGNEIKCGLCPHSCCISEGFKGKCGVRANRDGVLYAESYGKVTSIALDPIEKKPLYMFMPGKKIVSVGSYGCNFKCPFCQNYGISLEYENVGFKYMTPELVTEIALSYVPDDNIGVAYTYNEPFVGYEFVKNCSHLIKEAGLMNVLVTNGYINKEPLIELLPVIDAMNIDLKGNNNRTYNKVGGTLDAALNTIETASGACHVEVTTLIIPNENDDQTEEIAKRLSAVDPEIPYHLSRFFPRYKFSDRSATSPEIMYKAYDSAKKHLKNVYLGNM